ncbi:MAG: DUF6680 family protein [Syntrophales bacterium]|jgi:hypothetical protein
MEIINLFALLFSPLIAVLVSVFLQSKQAKNGEKKVIFSTLIATRHSPINDQTVRALNMIDVVFYKNKNVRRLWREYYDMLHNTGLNNELGYKTRQTKNLELITEMAKDLGYSKEITALDVERVYYPVGLGQAFTRSEEIANELLRVLKASGGLQITEKSNV